MSNESNNLDILLGTNNQFKQREMQWHLEGLEQINIHYLNELPERIEVEEDQKTLLGNAQKKAIEISNHTDWIVFTSDAGVDIPGIPSWDLTKPKRTVGADKPDLQRAKTLLEIMKDLKGDQRLCEFHIALALAHKGELIWSEETICERGLIVDKLPNSPIGKDLWMGRVWWYPELQKTDDQLTPEERAEIREKYQSDMRQRFQEQVNKLKSSE